MTLSKEDETLALSQSARKLVEEFPNKKNGLSDRLTGCLKEFKRQVR